VRLGLNTQPGGKETEILRPAKVMELLVRKKFKCVKFLALTLFRQSRVFGDSNP